MRSLFPCGAALRAALSVLLWTVVSLGGWTLRAQQQIVPNIAAQEEAFQQERIYIMTDSPRYLAGERIHFKCQVVDAATLQNLEGSRYVYVELRDSTSGLRGRVKIIERGGLYAGHLDIPQDTGPGLYTLLAYTRYTEGNSLPPGRRTLQVGGRSRLSRLPYPDDTGGDPGRRTLSIRREGGMVNLSTTLPGGHYLLGMCRGILFHFGGLSSARGARFAGESLPEGVVEFHLVGPDMSEEGCASLVVPGEGRRCPVPMALDHADGRYAAGDSARLSLSTSSLMEGEVADLCARVVRRGVADPYGVVEDLLLRNPGPRYCLDSILAGRISRPARAQEGRAEFTGTVKGGLLSRPVAGARVSVIAPTAGLFDMTVTDSLGRFHFGGLDAPVGTYFVFKSADSKGEEKYRISLDGESFPEPAPDYLVPDIVRDTAGRGFVLPPEEWEDGTVLLEASSVSAQTSAWEAPPEEGFNRLADFSLTPERIETIGALSLEDLLRWVPGVFFRDGKIYLRAAMSILGDVPAAVAIDGVILEQEYEYSDLDIHIIERVDVFKTGQSALWGTAGSGGVINLTTKSGSNFTRPDRSSMARTTPLGYQRRSPFKPTGRTLYWNPSVMSDELVFGTGTGPGAWTVVLEGVTSLGRLVYETIPLDVAGN